MAHRRHSTGPTEPHSEREAVAEILSVTCHVAQPFGTVNPARTNLSATIWRTVAGGLYFLEPRSARASPGSARLARPVRAPPARKLALAGQPDDSIVGQVGHRFEPSEPSLS